jgi:hypothetical protein
VRTIAWPSGLERQAATAATSCRARPLPNTIRPCRTDVAHGPGAVDVAERAVFPVHHVAACCVVGAVGWAALITGARFGLHLVAHLV